MPALTDSSIKNKSTTRLEWIDIFKGIAIIWIFWNHLSESLFGGPFLSNPSIKWPSLIQRLEQMYPVSGWGIWDIPINLFRYIGWAGDQGVQLFLIISGFGLTWGLLVRKSDKVINLGNFYFERFQRIYPMWWGVHILFIIPSIMFGLQLNPSSISFYLSMLGIRCTPDFMYLFSPAWWYIGLLIQLYLLFPFLWYLLQRFGPVRFLFIGLAIGIASRLAGLLVFDNWLDAWSRGAIFITRLPEFIFGMVFASWFYNKPEKIISKLHSPLIIFYLIIIYIIGTILSATLVGMSLAPAMLGITIFILLYKLLIPILTDHSLLSSFTRWIGRYSYSIYLIHHPIIIFLAPKSIEESSLPGIIIRCITIIIITLVSSVIFEKCIVFIVNILKSWYSRYGALLTFGRIGIIGLSLIVIIISAELSVRYFAPQEVLGWGERISLKPNPTFGYTLKPDTTTHLRWESYDYYVKANSLGFPGKLYPEKKSEKTIRILITGDAFTSAEGVDTDFAWPRLLEKNIQNRVKDIKIEVLNFAVTGYGPKQYSAVAEKFAPVYQPDIIIIGFFVNDFFDVLWTNYEEVIGFHLPPQDGIGGITRLLHLRSLFNHEVKIKLNEIFRNKIHDYGYALGNFSALEKNRIEVHKTGRSKIISEFNKIKNISKKIGARVIAVMIPASVQICSPSDLNYYPVAVNLKDSSRFDVDQPQRIAKSIFESVKFNYYDLREILKSCPECPYQSRNMHWTLEGHRIVGSYISDLLINDGYINFK